ncbi:hypothetical protein [Myxococcus xanthus]|uniref:hypothetical protein n=1 Tax=Myxococcus xanthus TaxID=34 RepID=UPI0011270317|nr:hypothetical protein [Myxococcus xanthus]
MGQRGLLPGGNNFGAVGFREFPRYGDDAMLSGYPYHCFASVDAAGNALWLTLHRAVTGSAALLVE